MSSFSDWFYSIPLLTRYWFSGTVLVSLGAKFGFLNPVSLILHYESLKQFQIWRLFTSVLFYPTRFHFLINLYFLYTYSSRLESVEYHGRPADYLYLLTFNWIACIAIGLISNIYLLMDPMVLSILYVWCQLNKDTIVTFWFGLRFKAQYLPWALLLFNLVVSDNAMMEFIGILIGHLYIFLKYKYPEEMGGPDFLTTPEFIKRLFPDVRPGGQFSGFGRNQNRSRSSTFGGGHNWGQGHLLGQN